MIKKYLYSCIVLSVICMCPIITNADPNPNLPFADDFESYPNNTPLNTGVNGWYASSEDATVQNATKYAGAQAAQIPIDITLSNSFAPQSVDKLWIEMMLRPVFYDGEDTEPDVAPNATAMFYFSKDGRLVVHEGSPSPTTNWLEITKRPNGSPDGTVFQEDDWIQIHIFQDFTNKSYFVFANGLLMTNDTPFVNSTIATFNGFDLYNGSGATSFLDNVAVMTTSPPNLTANSADFVPGIGLDATNFQQQIFVGQNPPNQSFTISKANGFFPLFFTNTLTTAWVNVSADSGISDGAGQEITLSYATDALGLKTEPYHSEIKVAGNDARLGFASTNSPATVHALVYIQQMDASTNTLNNFVMIGNNAANQTFNVESSGAGEFAFTLAPVGAAAWVASITPNSSALTNQGSCNITLGYDTDELPLGHYDEIIRVKSATAGGATQNVAVALNVQNLVAAPLGVTNFAMSGNTAPAQTFAVKSEGAGSFTFGIITNNGASWLTLDSGQGTLTDVQSNDVQISYASAALAPGAYADTLKVFTSDGGGATQNVAVALNVQNLVAAPLGVTNFAMSGNTAPAQTFAVKSEGAGSFTFGIITNNGASWLTLDSGQGTLTDVQSNDVQISYASAALAPGAYTDTLKVFTSDGGGATQNVAVALNVQSLAVSKTVISNQITEGQAAPSETFQVQSSGIGTVPYTVTVANNETWLTPNPTNGALVNTQNNDITINYSTAGLAVGNHSATLRVATTVGGGATQTITVVMTVIGGEPGGGAIQVTPTALTQTTTQGKNPDNQTFAVSTTNAGQISYFITVPQGGDWLKPTPSSGALNGPATNTITLAYMTAGLVAGVHTGLVDVSTPDAGGATQRVTIAMIVAPMTGPLLVEPTLLTNAALIGETPVTQYFAVFTTSSIPIAYTVTAPDTDEWLAPEPVSGILTNAQQTDTVAVVYATQYLDAGVYTSAIEIATAAGGGATQIVTVIMTVFDRVLPAPEGVTASQGAFTDRVRIQWLSVDNAERYTIWRHTSDSTNDATQIGTVDSSLGVRSTLAFDDPGAASGIRYYYWVRAHNSAGPGPLSLAAQGWRGLEAPAAITASQGDYHDRIALEWSAVAGATTYEVWRGLTPEIDSASRLATTSSTTLDDGNLAAPTHYYWARSGNAMGFGPFSQAAKGWRRATGPGDFSGNGKADAWYYYQAYGMWYIVPSEGDPYNIRFGWWETEATPGDYDGDGRLNLGVYHRAAGIWYLALNSGLYACLFGHPEADPVPADYDGDGITDLGVYFPAYGAWYVLRLDGTLLAWNSIWGGPGLRAVRGDFDGDRKEDLAVYDQRNGCWYVTGLDGTLLVWAFPFGFQGAEPISGDFDGDKRTDFCVYYPAAGMWYIYTWQGEFRSVAWGWAEARPVAADFDGDGVDDIAVFHHDRFDARWYLLQSKDGYRMISSRENR